jgi:nucleotide-binding universal stress UspA family protein
MSAILCPVRGGPDSQPTIQRALALAQEHQMKIVFLYVVNLDFLASTASSRSHVIREELTELGQFILEAARLRAEQAGVQSETAVREGNVSEQIVAQSRESGARYIVLGAPRHDRSQNVFAHQGLDDLAARLQADTGAQVILAEGA